MADEVRAKAPTSKDILNKTSWGLFFAYAFLSILTAPYRRTFKLYTWKPLAEFRAAGKDSRAFIGLVREWKANKYQELQSVQVAASFCAGATLATISWTKLNNPIWVADALWFSSLICSIWAVVTSIQTKSILDDLPDKDELSLFLPEPEIKRVRKVILRYKKTPGFGHWIMMFIWQFPSMTMSYAWCTFLSGLTVYVCTPFVRNEAWDNRHKVAIVYLSVGGVGLFTYFFSSMFVYAGEKDYERSCASTRVNTTDLEGGAPEVHTGPEKEKNDGSVEANDSYPNLRSTGLLDREGEASRRGTGRANKPQLLI
ncbi:hypothetical protein P154DRAFT_569134 [Amniculicola lignicola CBS 123094]|uniref:Uncharacterized protein n=1 Tax=Amniculicola lignicola CBS 123094 TaxID=1392246 RepID=A0A6A5X2I7_9PLEO|nr:hypothetical protein P154DRAFT_569134 [Amniculicola lignicola CBS 123094]